VLLLVLDSCSTATYNNNDDDDKIMIIIIIIIVATIIAIYISLDIIKIIKRRGRHVYE
jgi:uncharacterized membrane protein